MRIGLAALLGAGLVLAGCGSQPAQNTEAAAPPEASAGDAMASDAAAPPAGEANTDAMASAPAPEEARPDFGEPGASKSTVRK